MPDSCKLFAGGRPAPAGFLQDFQGLPGLGRLNAKKLQAYRVGGDSMDQIIAAGGIIEYNPPKKMEILSWDVWNGQKFVPSEEWDGFKRSAEKE